MVFEPPKANPVPVKMAFTQNKLPVADASSTASASESLFRDYQTNARFSLGMNILSVGLMPKASYQVSIIGRAAITRRRAGE